MGTSGRHPPSATGAVALDPLQPETACGSVEGSLQIDEVTTAGGDVYGPFGVDCRFIGCYAG